VNEASPHKGKQGLQRIGRAFTYSVQGLKSAYQFESAFRQALALAICLIAIACLLPASLLHKVLLIVPIFIVLITELLNSAIEATVDRISLDNHALSKKAKDLGSAAVLVSLTMTFIVWILVLVDLFG
jgi:diacylglycerol kinase (ATP)